MALSRVVSEIFNVEKYRDLEIPVKSQSRSLKVVPFDRLGIVSYVFYSNFVQIFYSSIVTMALSRVASEIFNVEKYRDLKIRVKGQSRSLKMVTFDRLRLSTVSY